MGWVLQPVVTREIGLRAGQLRGMIDKGKLQRGHHYKVVDRKTFFDLEALQAWLDTAESTPSARPPETTRRRPNLEKVQNPHYA